MLVVQVLSDGDVQLHAVRLLLINDKICPKHQRV